MFELISLWLFNLLYPEQKSPAARKDEMNTAAAFYYGTSFEPERRDTVKDQSQSTESDSQNDWPEDLYDWLD
jgi:hypothetical protein